MAIHNIGVVSASPAQQISSSVDAQGGRIYIPGDGYKYHVFTTSGVLSVYGNLQNNEFDILTIGGGGGAGGAYSDGAYSYFGGGGGGGGVVEATGVIVPSGSYTISIGAGGPGQSYNASHGGVSTSSVYQGSTSTAFAGSSLALYALGGGAGGTFLDPKGSGGGSAGGAAATSVTQGQLYSVRLNGSTQYLSLPSTTAFAFGTGDFTVEAWVYYTGALPGSTYIPIAQSDAIGSSSNDKWFFAFTNTTLNFQTHSSGGFTCTTPLTLATNQWYHFAVTRNSGTIRLFVNGSSGTVTTSGTPSGYSLSQNGLIIGAMSTPYYVTGYISNIRIITGTALYTSTFTPSAIPLIATTNTSLLTCQSPGRLTTSTFDLSTNSNIITTVNSATLSPFHPFTSLNSFFTATSYSVYFNGVNNYLTVPDSALLELAANNFTIEMWIYPQYMANESILINKVASGSAVGSFDLRLNVNKTLTAYASALAGSSWSNTFPTTTAVTSSTWSHIVYARSGNNFAVHINGVYVGGFVSAITLVNEATTVNIGANGNGTSPFSGYISNVRIINGTAIYSTATSFTPSTSPLTTATVNTVLLTCQNYSIVDNSTASFTISNFGPTAVVYSSPFSTATSFVGTGPALQPSFAPNSRLYSNSSLFTYNTNSYVVYSGPALGYLSSSDWTVELWINRLGSNSSAVTASPTWNPHILDTRWDATSAAIVVNLSTGSFSVNTGTIQLGLGAATANVITGTTVISTGTWYHIAAVKSGGVAKLYVNGVQEGVSYTDASTYISTTATIGARYTSVVNTVAGRGYDQRPWHGFISNLRIVAQAIYTGTFTPATAPLTNNTIGATGGGVAANLTGTVILLTAQTGGNVDVADSTYINSDLSLNSYTVTVGNTSSGYLANVDVGPFTSGAITGGSIFFDGKNSHIRTPVSAGFFLAGDFTIEGWLYVLSLPAASTQKYIIAAYNATANTRSFAWVIDNTGGVYSLKLIFSNNGIATSTYSQSWTPIPRTWYHTAVVRSGNTTTTYINGASIGSTSSFTATNFITYSDFVSVGTDYPVLTSGYYFQGFISNLRITRKAVYTGNFFASTSSLATTQIYDPNNPYVSDITPVITNGYSAFMDGSSDYITLGQSTTDLYNIGPTPYWTIECWAYPTYIPTTATGVIVSAQTTVTNGSWKPNLGIYWSSSQQFGPYIGATDALIQYGVNYIASFNGTNQYLSTTKQIPLGALPFTMEAWIYPTVSGTSRGIANNWQGGGEFQWSMNTSNQLTFTYTYLASGTGSAVCQGTRTIPINVWTHAAVVRSGNTISFYVNGILDTAVDISANPTIYYYNGAGKDLRIGVNADLGNYFTGYISNFRIVTQKAVYTGNFAPPYTTLSAYQASSTNITNLVGTETTFLSLTSSGFTDSATSPGTIVNNNAVGVVNTPNPFTFNSVLFNGSNQYLSIPDNAALQLTGAFTIEAFVYFVTAPSTQQIWAARGGSVIAGSWSLGTVGSGNGATRFYYDTSGVGVTFNTSLSVSTWYHIALVRDGNSTLSCYINGVKEATTATVTTSFNISTTTLFGTSRGAGAPWFNGYLSNVRIVKDTAVYTGNFAISTSPLTAVTGTSLLTCQDLQIIDRSIYTATITVVSSPTVASLNPFSTVYYGFQFNGTNQYLTVPANSAFAFGTSNFTVECWVYMSVAPTSGEYAILDCSGSGAFGISITSTTIKANVSTLSSSIFTKTLIGGTWYHIAFTRVGTTVTCYVNGVSIGTNTMANSFASPSALNIGRNVGANSSFYNGYLTNLRIVNGTAVYAGNFTVPNNVLSIAQSSSTNISALTGVETSLLTLNSSSLVDQSVNAFTITNNGSVTTSTLSPAPFVGAPSAPLNLNTWYHLALVQNGGISSQAFYINGQLQSINVNTPINVPTNFNVGTITNTTATTTYFQGYISNTRITRGVAVYTGNFTVPSSPLNLTQSESTNISAIPGTISTATYSANFSGLRAYVTGTNFTAFDQDVDFTVEMWLNVSKSSTATTRIYCPDSAGPSNVGILSIGLNSSGNIIVDNQTTTAIATSTSAMVIGNWYHIALVRSGATTSNVILYINGTAEQTVSYSSWSSAPRQIYIGTTATTAGPYFNGYISNLRVVRGIPVYTGNFTTPTPPLALATTASTNIAAVTTQTVFLTFQDSFITDKTVTTSTNLVVTNSVYVSTNTPLGEGYASSLVVETQSLAIPSGYTSGYFNGSTFYSYPYISQYLLGTNNFTIEGWIYPTVIGANGKQSAILSNSLITGGNSFEVQMYSNGANAYVRLNTFSTELIATSVTITTNTWYHFAFSRIGNNCYAFLNGTLTTTVSGTFTGNYTGNSGASYLIGSETSSGGNYFQGYITNLRVVNGTGLYSTTFNPPLAPLDNITNTALLALQSSSNSYDASSYNVAPSITGVASQSSSIVPFSAVGSAQFTGANHLTFTNSVYFAFSAAFTIEFWINASLQSDSIIMDFRNNGTGNAFLITTGGASTGTTPGSLRYALGITNTGQITSGGKIITDGAWHHCAVVRSGAGAVTLYVDGTAYGSGTDGNNYSITSAQTIFIGRNSYNAGGFLTGYLSNLRIVNNAAVYNSTYFTAPTQALSIYSTGTALLALQNPAAIDDRSPYNVTITNNATVIASAQYPFASSVGATYYGNTAMIPDQSPFGGGQAMFLTAQGYSPYTINDTGWNLGIITIAGTATNTLVSPFQVAPRINQYGSTGTTIVTRGGSGGGSSNSGYSPLVQNVNSLVASGRQLTRSLVAGTDGMNVQTPPAASMGFLGSAGYYAAGGGGSGPYAQNIIAAQVDGTSYMYINSGTSNAFKLGTNDFTIECWALSTEATTNQINEGIFSLGPDTGTTNASLRINLKYNTSAVLPVWEANFVPDGNLSAANGVYLYQSAASNTGNYQWVHHALQKRGQQYQWFVNGSQVLAVNTNSNFTDINYLFIGRSLATSWKGFISNVRLVSGIAVYTGNFTPSRLLTVSQPAGYNTNAITTQTQLLVLSTTTTDLSANNLAIRNTGTFVLAVATATNTLIYSTLTTNYTILNMPAWQGGGLGGGTTGLGTPISSSGGLVNVSYSVLFGGGTTSITASGAIFDWGGMWQVELWVYANSVSGTTIIFSTRNSGDSGTGFGWDLQLSSGTLNVTTANFAFLNGVGTILVNTWYHIVVRTDNNTRTGIANIVLGINGVQTGALAIDRTTYSFTAYTQAKFGGDGGSGSFSGYISNLRVLIGASTYSGSTYSYPSSPPTAITGGATSAQTVLLTANASPLSDISQYANALTSVGGPTVSTTNPFGNAITGAVGATNYSVGNYAGSFAGGSFLRTTYNNWFVNSATVECWIYTTSTTKTSQGIFGGGIHNYGVNLGYNDASGAASQKLVLNVGNGGATGINISSNKTLGAGTWNHISLVKTAGTSTANWYLFINGAIDSGVNSTAYGHNWFGTNFYIGASTSTVANRYFSGYISNFAIHNYMKYVPESLFVPLLDGPVTTTTNTVLLTLNTGTILDATSSGTVFINSSTAVTTIVNNIGFLSNNVATLTTATILAGLPNTGAGGTSPALNTTATFGSIGGAGGSGIVIVRYPYP
jgi:hypothetical protein